MEELDKSVSKVRTEIADFIEKLKEAKVTLSQIANSK